ncbi:PREDICTED: serine-rich adhesin for platelets [Polistes dominula]|uniref:Serine-rich adhesin for platelets n=1 Tax=Polistes dominula TaxID=743375 RepID=A0ABM1IA96_POLDO|nr:PREDICTED: serine-rich adhesin for platelets [Polistes dominula]
MEVGKGSVKEDFVTVVTVGNQTTNENFVTVLSIGTVKKDEDEDISPTTTPSLKSSSSTPTTQQSTPPSSTSTTTGSTKLINDAIEAHLEEEVEVYRLPGERLGFGLKFEGGNKTSERVRRLFVQSCAEQSPASRAKCSWGSLGEGDEVLSIDGVPVTHMTRLDCVRRLKESQLVIRLMVRCRGALRPEVVSAERKAAAAAAAAASERKNKIPPELPSLPPPPLPPPVPPRKLRQTRGSADGEANPSPVKKSLNGAIVHGEVKNVNVSPKESPKGSPKDSASKHRSSPDTVKLKQEPPEAMIYLDARSQCGSTHGSTSDETGSSLSTVVDKFSSSDRVSTISTTSTGSTGSEQHNNQHHQQMINSFEQLERELSSSNPPDYLLHRLASSEAVTHVESRGEVERITAVVAPNTVLIEETIALQPPLSFQDAPLSYGHEPRPDLFYAADLAADSTTHFRPIKDDAELVERVVNDDQDEEQQEEPIPRPAPRDKTPPPLPARNHVNRINVNQQQQQQQQQRQQANNEPSSTENHEIKDRPDLPVLPPKPLPRKDVKARRKRPPPPPPPPPPQPPQQQQQQPPPTVPRRELVCPTIAEPNQQILEQSVESFSSSFESDQMSLDEFDPNHQGINKVLEIIELRKAKALSPNKEIVQIVQEPIIKIINDDCSNDSDAVTSIVVDSNKNEIKLDENDDDDNNDDDVDEDDSSSYKDAISLKRSDTILSENSTYRESEEDDETYKSLDEVNDDLRNTNVNRVLSDENDREIHQNVDNVVVVVNDEDDDDNDDDDDSTDDSDDGDYYWQSNLATIGEEEETNSLEYVSVEKKIDEEDKENKDTRKSNEIKMVDLENERDETSRLNRIEDFHESENTKTNKDSVNDRMDNCGGGQRLPPDGDEFPAAYQEFANDNATQHEYRFPTNSTTATITAAAAAATTTTSTMATTTTIINNNNNNNNSTENNSFRLYENDNKKSYNVKVLNNDNNNVVGSRSEMNYFETNLEDKSTNRNFSNSIGHNSQSDGSSPIANGDTMLISEKKIEIAAYYHKDIIPTIETEIQIRSEEICPEVPPPLPLTGPPKLEQLNLHSKSIEQSPKKFSINVDPWRQDDKSERSVRDKIAMFSSQSSLDAPLFPNTVNVANVNNVRKLSKYKSSEDVCSDEKSPNHKERCSFFSDRTQSSFDLTDSAKSYSPEGSPCKRYPNSSKMLPPPPPVPQKPTTSLDTKNYIASLPMKSYSPSSTISSPDNIQSSTKLYSSSMLNSPIISPINSPTKMTSTPVLTRATSFSGSSSFTQERSSGNNDVSNGNNQVSRTNSLASTFRRNSEDMRRTSLNQLIEQRRRSISKLRGLVIPEKETVPIEQPIVDLPEIKSRNSILLSQLPKANIHDKWGSQSSIASNTSSASVPLKATSFKMPAPQINSKYSPAFKRKSLTVYGSSSNTINSSTYMTKNTQGNNNTSSNTSNTLSEPPKSLESICSPTRSDYSFEFVSTSNSPDVLRGRPRTNNTQRKTRNDYDDSDNDSAVSSSQSSISRGFSPPMSPVPSERSTVSSERSYVSNELNYQRRSFIIDTSNKTFVKSDNESIINTEQFHARPNILNNERTYVSSERSSSSSSSTSSSNPHSPQPVDTTRNSQIPQRQTLRRSNSTETNCSTSSTLTSGSQASAESLSRRVLKPQSVEAINRKNILASARCRSGRDLNGSPLIQRKFSDEEENHAENGGTIRRKNNVNNGVPKQDIKIAYIEVTDSFLEEDDQLQRKIEEPKLPPKRTIITPAVRPPKSEMLEPSNDLKMWVRAEAKALARSSEEKLVNTIEKGNSVALKNQTTSRNTNEQYNSNDLGLKKRSVQKETEQISQETMKQRCKVSTPIKKTQEDQNDLLTILTTRSRSRSAIHVDDGSFGRSKSQMSLEDILSAKVESPCPKLLRTQSSEDRTENGSGLSSYRPSPESRDNNNRFIKKSPTNSNDSWREDKPFVSKIPTLGRSRNLDNNDETEITEKSKNNTSKIPTARNLGRRSVSVTDMKKALDKIDATTNGQNQQVMPTTSHNRFPSLDSSVDENISSIGNETDNERFCNEQFGSISSLASSTSLISQQELAQLVEEASLEEARCAHEVIVVLLHKENPTGSVGITLAGGADCEVKEITVHRVLAHSIADKDGRVQRGDRILSINGRSARGLTHRESLTVLKQPRSEVVLVVSRPRIEEGCKLRSRTASVETIVEGFEMNAVEDTAWGPPSMVAVYKDGAGLGFSLEGGRDSPLGDKPLVIKKIFTGGAAEKTGALKAGDQLLEVNGSDVTRMSRIEAWSLMKKLHDGEVNLLVRHPATKSS